MARTTGVFPVDNDIRMERQRAGIQPVESGFALLDALANSSGPLMLRDLAAASVMNAAKAHRYLMTFQRLALVVQDAGTTRYDLGPKTTKLGLASMEKPGNVSLAFPDVPSAIAELAAWLDEVRRHGVARVVDALLPGVAGFCAPVFDADGHLELGMVTLGSLATFDPEFDGAVATPLRISARQLSSDLGYLAA